MQLETRLDRRRLERALVPRLAISEPGAVATGSPLTNKYLVSQ
jgi:hypothetical protein